MNLKALELDIFFFLFVPKDPQLVDKLMQDLGANKDNEVDFNEFVVRVASLTVDCRTTEEERKVEISSKLI